MISSSLIFQDIFEYFVRSGNISCTGVCAASASDTTEITILFRKVFYFSEGSMPESISSVIPEIMTIGNHCKIFQHATIPNPYPFTLGQSEVNFLVNIETVTGRADKHTGAAGKTFVSEIFPDRMIIIPGQEFRGDIH
jgi:hypothetical protein